MGSGAEAQVVFPLPVDLVVAAAVTLALLAWALILAGEQRCEPVLVIDRPAGSLKVYPGNAGGEQERLTLSLCYDGSVTGRLERYRNQRQEVKP